MAKAPEKEVMYFESAETFEAWLMENHDSCHGIWLKLVKKNSKVPAPTYAEALEIALCFGWIDSQVRKLDENLYLQSYTPRRSRSPWSKRNIEISTRLIDEGRMRPPGLAEIERAKSDGRWDRAYDGPAKAKPAAEFLEALEGDPVAKRTYDGLNAQERFLVYYRIQEAKREETRQRRMKKFLEQLSRGEKPG